MAVDVGRVAQLLQVSLDPRQNKQAEIELRREEQVPSYPLALLSITQNEQSPPVVRLASSLAFKNLVKRKWTDTDGHHLLEKQIVTQIKQRIVGLMITVPPNIRSQLGDAVGVIAESDFLEKWDTLVDDLVSQIRPDDPKTNLGILQVAHSIFKRWRPLFRSDKLFTEINFVLDRFGTPFTQLLADTDKGIEANKTNKAALIDYYNQLNMLIKLFYDLSCQDLPPVFEDHLQELSGLLQKYLIDDAALLHTGSDEEAGPLEFVKSGILEALSLYVLRYGDAFESYVSTFLQSTWSLLTTIGVETKYDILVSKALHFLTSVTNLREHAQAFGNEATISEVVEKVAIPNLNLRDSDLELFEDEPIEFIRRDLEGSDSETRRRAATDFLRALLAQHEDLTTKVVNRYLEHFLEDYSANPGLNWKSKDIAVYLFSAIAAKGAVTAREGVKTVNQNLSVLDFFDRNIAQDLTNASSVHPILIVDAIKYLYIFRSQLSKEQWGLAFPLLIPHLRSENYVIYTYTTIAVERVLALTDANGAPIIDVEALNSQAPALLEHLFNLIEKDSNLDNDQATAKVQENEFLMCCVMRVLIVLRERIQPLTEMLLKHLMSIVNLVVVNPSNPRFCHYLFEAIGAIIRFAAPQQPALVEGTLHSPLAAILDNDNQDFMPYVFQLFAGLLEANPSDALPNAYKTLVGPIIKADIWLIKGNVPALTRLLTSLIRRGSSEFVKGNQIEPVLGVFRQLISSKVNDLHGLDLLECIFTKFPPTVMQNYYGPVMQIVLEKLDRSKSQAFNLRFVRFYHLISAKAEDGLGADFFIKILDSISQGIYVPLYLKIILPGTPTLTRNIDRKIAVISLTKTLTKSKAFAETYAKGWSHTCNRLLELLINPPKIDSKEDDMHERDDEDMSFGVGYTELVAIRSSPFDYFPSVHIGKEWVGQELNSANNQTNGQIGQFIQQRLEPQSQTALMNYMQG